MEPIKPGDKFRHKTLNTVIEIMKPLGNDCWWVNGKMGSFKMREYLIRGNYEREPEDAK